MHLSAVSLHFSKKKILKLTRDFPIVSIEFFQKKIHAYNKYKNVNNAHFHGKNFKLLESHIKIFYWIFRSSIFLTKNTRINVRIFDSWISRKLFEKNALKNWILDFPHIDIRIHRWYLARSRWYFFLLCPCFFTWFCLQIIGRRTRRRWTEPTHHVSPFKKPTRPTSQFLHVDSRVNNL